MSTRFVMRLLGAALILGQPSAYAYDIQDTPAPPPEPESGSSGDSDGSPGFWEALFGGEVASKGELELESRVFANDGIRTTRDRGVGMFGRLEWRHTHGLLEERLRVYGRLDALDRERTVLVVEEANLQLKKGRFRLKLGNDIVSWTATEAFHPADVINARNLDSDLENLEKLGEPMASLQLGLFEGNTVQFLFMPVYTQTLFPSPTSRLSFVLPGRDLRARSRRLDRKGGFTDSLFGAQAALRIQQTVGSADLSLHALEHMDRLQPWIAESAVDGQPIPVFETVRQLGGTYQQEVLEGLLVKLEAAQRWFIRPVNPALTAREAGLEYRGTPFPNRDHATVAVGLEYGFTHGGGGQSTLVLEGQSVLRTSPEMARLLTPFQRDVLAAYRFAFEDEDAKELLLGVIVDIQDMRERLVSINYQQRLGEVFTVRAGLRLFDVPAESFPSAFSGLRGAGHFRLSLIRHF